MTAIAGITDGVTVWLGGDAAGVRGYDLITRADPKVFTAGPYVMGFTTSFRMGQLLHYKLKPPEPPEGGDLMRFMCTTFVDALRQVLKDGGWAEKDKERESGGEFLVGVAGRLFRVESDFQVSERADRYDACGCGEDHILGALFAAEDMDWSPRKRLNTALSAASRFSAGVTAPFTYVHSGAS